MKNILKLGAQEAEVVLVVPDPGRNERGVGSGGASLNALLVLTEHLSARYAPCKSHKLYTYLIPGKDSPQ